MNDPWVSVGKLGKRAKLGGLGGGRGRGAWGSDAAPGLRAHRNRKLSLGMEQLRRDMPLCRR